MSVKALKQEQQTPSPSETKPAPGEFQALLHRPVSLAPRTMAEAVQFAELAAKSSMVPKDYIGKSANIFLAVQMGAELGLSPMQALQNIAVVNGRPSLWGDAMLAVVMASAAYEWHDEKADATGATCTVKRKGQEPYAITFTVDQAKAAGLWAKGGPWTQYPQRMLQMRARGFALRDKFADVLRGLISVEEARDIPPREPPLMEAAQTFAAPEPEAPALPIDERLAFLHAMEGAPDTDALAVIFGEATAAAKATRDRAALEEFITAKDVAKARLQAAEATA